MAKIQADKRARLIETTMKLAYKHGFRETSLANIAEAAHVPVGNVYYYFKTKDELGEAVVERRLRRSSLNPCVGLRSSSGPLAMKRIPENSRSISFPPFRV